MRERDIESYLVKRVKECGGEVRKVQWIGRRGAPDRLVMMPARAAVPTRLFDMDQEVFARFGRGHRPAMTVWVELKSPGVKPEAHQVREHKRMRAMGQVVEVIDSLEAVEQLLS